jgi:hypothetical protein
MKGVKMRYVVTMGVLAIAVAAIGLVALATPAAAACEPVACPAIAKICPQGQLACRVSPCNCALACVPEGQCNN